MNKKKCAVVGAGFIGAAHVEALRRLGSVEVVALCDAQDAEEKAAQLGIDRAYSDYRAMMDELRLDAVHICTPNCTHYEIVKCAIEHGINFVCEKPFTTTIEQARELAGGAERGSRGCKFSQPDVSDGAGAAGNDKRRGVGRDIYGAWRICPGLAAVRNGLLMASGREPGGEHPGRGGHRLPLAGYGGICGFAG